MKKSLLLFAAIFIFSLFCLGCQQNSANNAESKTVPSARETDLQKIDTAKKLVYSSKESPSNLDKALEILRTIPADSKSYGVAVAMIKGIENQKNEAKTAEQTAAQPANQKNGAETVKQKNENKPVKQK
ncbi:MAG TPA: hypothetical protein VF596_00510 [Pyrinomonadaceae bacterium]